MSRDRLEEQVRLIRKAIELSNNRAKRTIDAFGKMIADGTTNELDIPSHYPYNPERMHLLVDGVRVFPEYNTVTQYNWDEDVHQLIPNAGETVVMESSELPRYTVQYEQIASWAFKLTQELQTGDKFRVGIYDSNNGWYFEHNSGHTTNQCDLVIRRAGVDIKKIENLGVEKAFTTWARYGLQFSWYNVGPAWLSQFYTEDNESRLYDIGSISIDDGGRGPQKGNLPLRYEVTAGPSTTGLILEAGSTALITLGDVSTRSRVKGTDFTDSITSANTWEPLRIFRLQSRTNIVNVKLIELDILNYSVDNEVRLLAMVMPSDLITLGAGDWEIPNEWSAYNNALETRDDVTGIPDNTGSTVPNAVNPGGFQIGNSIIIPITGQFQKGLTKGGGIGQKRNIPTQDVLVILGKSPQTGAVTYETKFEQDW